MHLDLGSDMSNPDDYTVGWICAIQTEYVAGRAFLDKEHPGPAYVSPHDNNAYTLGAIGEHNFVIAVLPDGEYGISSAAVVARDMMHSFHNVRIGLMVGIGGGAPSPKHDIRLGDIVVSAPRNGKGGIFQYDFGKSHQNQRFTATGFLNQPPAILRTAVAVMSGIYESDGHTLEDDINKILHKKPRLQKAYSRPDPNSDILYRPEVIHPEGEDISCVIACGTNLSGIVPRSRRAQDEDSPAIHYGVIASGNQLMTDASMRDKLVSEVGVLCFEMEVAGLMNHFPCLAIRGICDYSDSHKNKEWRGYAAMASAAYAKDLLCRIAPNRVEAENKISNVLSGLLDVAKEQRHIIEHQWGITKKHFQVQQALAKERSSEEEQKERQKCHQLFRLTDSSMDATYEWYKERVEERVNDTCLWFLEHEHFQNWLQQESGPLLVTADPGCGKSVLAKYLIDYGLPRSTTICYFFFKDQDQNTIQQALCAILHQLFSQKPALIEQAIPKFRMNGQGLISSLDSLWEILHNAIEDPQTGPVIIVLDALDECTELEFMNLMRNFIRPPSEDRHTPSTLKYLLTSRPYEEIVSKFRGVLDDFPKIHIPGEDESETISQEVNHVITYRVNQLSAKKCLSDQTKNHLERRLKEIPQRTYLWVHLVFNYLGKEDFKKTQQGIDESIIMTLPATVNQAYEQILSKSKEHLMVRKTLCIILAASRPLTLSEMNIAVNIDITSRTFNDLDLEDENSFKLRLRSLCGLFISVYHGKIYLIHQTARDFLLGESISPTSIIPKPHWHHSITSLQAHTVLAERCVLYLNLFNSNLKLTTDVNSIYSRAFLDYSATAWGAHFGKAGFTQDHAIIPFALRIYDPDSESYSVWFSIYWETTGRATTESFTDLMLASYFGHHTIVKLLLDKGAELGAKDNEYGHTPLWWAVKNGHESVVKLLLENGAEVDSKDNEYGQTPLWLAVKEGHEGAVKLLCEKRADIEMRDSEYCRTPLISAVEEGHVAVTKLLLDKGANIEAVGGVYGQTPLRLAVRKGHVEIVKLLLDYGASPRVKNASSRTLLQIAVWERRKAVIKLLLDRCADVKHKDVSSLSMLAVSVWRMHHSLTKLLHDLGSDVEYKDGSYWTFGWVAVQNGREVDLLLIYDVLVETTVLVRDMHQATLR